MMLRSIEDRAATDAPVRRSFSFDDIQFRDDGPTGFSFEGIVAVVDHAYPVRDMFGEYHETIAKGAFDQSIRDAAHLPGRPISLYKGHAGDPFAVRSIKADTLTVTADPHLKFRADLDPSRPSVQELASMLRRKELTEMSIGFRPMPTRDKWNKDMTEVIRSQVGLREGSIVEVGANTGGTEANIRSLDEYLASFPMMDLTADEIRRAIAYFETRLPQPEVETLTDLFAERDRLDRDRHAMKRPAPILV